MNKTNCCEKCNPVIPGILGMQMGFCKDDMCECHTAPTNKETTPEWKDSFDEMTREYIAALTWSDDTPDIQKTLVIGNIRGFAEKVKKEIADLPERILATATAEARHPLVCTQPTEGDAICGVRLDCHVHDWRMWREEAFKSGKQAGRDEAVHYIWERVEGLMLDKNTNIIITKALEAARHSNGE